MRKIKLVPGEAFYNRCDVDVYDVTEEREKKRCKIKVEYSVADIRQLMQQNMDKKAMIEHYKEWIYSVVKYYITDDWECTDGMEKIIAIIEENTEEYFKEGEEK